MVYLYVYVYPKISTDKGMFKGKYPPPNKNRIKPFGRRIFFIFLLDDDEKPLHVQQKWW